MANSCTELDVEKAKRDIHGEEVGRAEAFYCDFCTSRVPIDGPVMYDIVKVYDLPSLRSMANLQDGWRLDAARCQNCEVEGVTPETAGWEEAVVMLSINESNGVMSADTTNLTVIDHSPGDEGHSPPPVLPAFLNQQGASMARWGFVKSYVETVGIDVDPIPIYREILAGMEEETD